MVEVSKGIKPLPEIEGVDKTVVLTSEGGSGGRIPCGGRIPRAVVVVKRVWGLSDEVETFSSIFTRRTSWRSEDVTSGGTI
jgi:hypothetical protein